MAPGVPGATPGSASGLDGRAELDALAQEVLRLGGQDGVADVGARGHLLLDDRGERRGRRVVGQDEQGGLGALDQLARLLHELVGDALVASLADHRPDAGSHRRCADQRGGEDADEDPQGAALDRTRPRGRVDRLLDLHLALVVAVGHRDVVHRDAAFVHGPVDAVHGVEPRLT